MSSPPGLHRVRPRHSRTTHRDTDAGLPGTQKTEASSQAHLQEHERTLPTLARAGERQTHESHVHRHEHHVRQIHPSLLPGRRHSNRTSPASEISTEASARSNDRSQSQALVNAPRTSRRGPDLDGHENTEEPAPQRDPEPQERT
jgi:hypothetical protein